MVIIDNPGSGSHLSQEHLKFNSLNGTARVILDGTWSNSEYHNNDRLMQELSSKTEDLIYNVDRTIFKNDTGYVDDIAIDFIKDFFDKHNDIFEFSIILNIRHPLDQISSYHDRFQEDIPLDVTINRIKSYLNFIKLLKNRFPVGRIIIVKVEDIINDYDQFIDAQEKLTGVVFPKKIKIHSGSINKWGKHAYVKQLIEDDELKNLAESYEYSWPKGLAANPLLYKPKAFINAEITDFFLLWGMLTGQYDNSSSALRHSFSSFFMKNIKRIGGKCRSFISW